MLRCAFSVIFLHIRWQSSWEKTREWSRDLKEPVDECPRPSILTCLLLTTIKTAKCCCSFCSIHEILAHAMIIFQEWCWNEWVDWEISGIVSVLCSHVVRSHRFHLGLVYWQLLLLQHHFIWSSLLWNRTCYQRHWPMIYSQALESMYSNNAKANNNSNYRQESFAPLCLIQKHFRVIFVCYFLSFRCDALFYHRECHVSCLSIQFRIMRHFSRKLHTKQPTEKTIRSSDTECHTISTTLILFVSVFHSKTHTKSKMPFSMAYEKRSYFEISLCLCLSLSLWSASLNGVVRAINCRCKTIKCRIRKFSLGLSKVVSFFVWLIIYCIRIHTTFLSHSSSFSFSKT